MNDGSDSSAPLTRQIYTNRQLDAIAARWDARAKTWDHDLKNPVCHLNEDDAYPRFLRDVRLILEDRRVFCAREGVIDAGCGTGLVLAQVVSAFAWGIGVDISPEMIRAAQEKHIDRTRFLVGDCFNLPAICPPAGAVLSRGVLLSHYGPEHGVALLLATKAALVKGGFVIFDFLNEAGRAVHAHAPEHKTYYRREAICSLAQRAGFSKVTVAGEDDRRVLALVAERD
jgi:SAM-dependent methyltransferase